LDVERLNLLTGFISIHDGHIKIKDHNVKLIFSLEPLDKLKGLESVHGFFLNIKVKHLEVVDDHHQLKFFIVCHNAIEGIVLVSRFLGTALNLF